MSQDVGEINKCFYRIDNKFKKGLLNPKKLSQYIVNHSGTAGRPVSLKDLQDKFFLLSYFFYERFNERLHDYKFNLCNTMTTECNITINENHEKFKKSRWNIPKTEKSLKIEKKLSPEQLKFINDFIKTLEAVFCRTIYGFLNHTLAHILLYGNDDILKKILTDDVYEGVKKWKPIWHFNEVESKFYMELAKAQSESFLELLKEYNRNNEDKFQDYVETQKRLKRF